MLQRSFSTFPGGWPGGGLLLLRVAIGLSAVIHGGFSLIDGGNQTLVIRSAGFIALASGISLLMGFLTPVASFLVASESLGLALSWLPTSLPTVFDGRLSAMFVGIMAAAIIFLGPGAFSIDSRMFGRREIIIPPGLRLPKS